MALDESAMSDLLAALRAGGGLDIVREALALVLQALIDAEATEVIGADRYQRTASRTTHRNGSRARLLSTKAGDVELRIPKLREGPSSRCCWSRAGASTGPCWRWSWRPMCMAPPPARSTTWSRPWAWMLASPSPRSAGSVPSSTERWQHSAHARWPTPPSPTCSWTPPTSRPAWTAGWSAGRW